MGLLRPRLFPFGKLSKLKSAAQGLNVKLLAASALLASYWYQVEKVGVVPVRSIKSFSMQAVRQVVSTDVLIVGRLDVDVQSFASIGSHKIDCL